MVVDTEIAAKIAAQEELCAKKDWPRFAPLDGYCYQCNRQIYNKITLEKAGSEHITGCPCCCWSFCD